jgi:hypothetical protein
LCVDGNNETGPLLNDQITNTTINDGTSMVVDNHTNDCLTPIVIDVQKLDEIKMTNIEHKPNDNENYFSLIQIGLLIIFKFCSELK